MIWDQYAYDAEFSDESMPMKIRAGTNEGKDALVVRMQYDEKTLYFTPEVCIIMGLIDGSQVSKTQYIFLCTTVSIMPAANARWLHCLIVAPRST